MSQWGLCTHHQIPEHHHCQEKDEAYGFLADLHAGPHVLNPFPTEDPEDDEEGMEEVIHVPAWQFFTQGIIVPLGAVVFSKELLANQSEDKHNDGQDHGEVPQRPDRVADDLDEGI